MRGSGSVCFGQIWWSWQLNWFTEGQSQNLPKEKCLHGIHKRNLVYLQRNCTPMSASTNCHLLSQPGLFWVLAFPIVAFLNCGRLESKWRNNLSGGLGFFSCSIRLIVAVGGFIWHGSACKDLALYLLYQVLVFKMFFTLISSP